MKIIRVAALLLLCVFSANGAWTLNPSPTKVNAEIDIQTSQHSYLSAFYALSDGTPHVTMGFRAASSPYQIWDVNLSNSVSRLLTVTPGLPPYSASALTWSNTLVLGSGEPSHMWEYNPVTGATNYIKAGADRDYHYSAVGFDGIVYFGTYPLAMVDSYNPADGSNKNWGQLDTAVTNNSYAYRVGADANYIYGSVKKNGSPDDNYLVIIRKSDTNRTVLWNNNGGSVERCNVFKGTNGQHFVLQNTNAVTKWFLLTNEVPVLLGSTPVYEEYPQRLNPFIATGPAYLGWDIQTTLDVSSASGSAVSATMRFKLTNDVVYTTVTQTNGWIVTPGIVDILQPMAGALFWITDAYGPCGVFEPHGLTSIVGPYKNLSTYDVLQVSATEVYLSGYYSSTLRWNPTQPWTRAPLMTDYTDPAYNPYTALDELGIYHYRLALGSNGNIYIGTDHDREGPVGGGELHWYKPSDGTHGSERTEFLDYDVNDLKPAEGASKIVYVSGESNIFVWAVSTFTKLTNFTVLNGATLQRVVEYQPGQMIGVSGSSLVGFTTTGTQLWSNTLPAQPWDGFASKKKVLTLGPDNYAWICAGGNLLRVNPTNGTYASILPTTTDYNVVFDGGDAYLYGNSTTVWELPDLLIDSGTPPYGTIPTISAVTANVGGFTKAP